MASQDFTRLDLLLKEIEDPYIQENFYRLKLFLEALGFVGGTSGGEAIGTDPGDGGSSSTGVEVKKLMNCAVSVAINDWVYHSGAADNTAVKATDNNPATTIIGMVIEKPSTTTCQVMLVGIASLGTARGNLYLGAAGTAQTLAPATGYLQRIGISFGDGTILVRPDFTRIRRI